MKTRNFTLFSYFLTGSKKRMLACLLAISFFLFPTQNITAQCTAGWIQSVTNWDNLDFFTWSGNYSSGYLPAVGSATTQHFALGKNRMSIAYTGSITNNGENAINNADAGEDLDFDAVSGSGQTATITITFDTVVRNLSFSIYDIDRRQVVNVQSRDASNTLINTQLVRRNVAGLVLSLSPLTGLGTSPTATSTNTTVNDNNHDGTIDVTVAGPVKTVTLNISNVGGGVASPELYLSKITACVFGSWPNNYYNISRPFTGQPGYILHAFDRSVYAVNPANGVTKLMFTDNTMPFGAYTSSNRCYINSMGYDPYNRILYYVYSLSSNPGNNRMLKKYDFNTETISTVVADLETIGIPLTDYAGVESGAAAFYDGKLYLGVETSNDDQDSYREAVIWRLDFNGSNVPYRASQMFAIPIDDGNDLLHDWADFFINDGILYDFDGAGVTTETDIYHMNMSSMAVTNYNAPAGFTPGQPTVAWNGSMFQLYATAAAPAVNAYIAPYNGNGTIGTRTNLTSTPAFTPAIPSLGDAAEAFRPKSDFGDAPASYHPNALSPATHEYLATLRLGSTYDREWNLTTSTNAGFDGADEDGIGGAPALPPGGSVPYTITVSAFNNTGGQATVIAWLDYNQNGVFDAAEGRAATINSSASAQNVVLNWANLNVPVGSNTFTFLRIRITRTVNGMTTSTPTGWFDDGEVEDYPVVMSWLVSKELLSFNADKKQQAVETKWSVNSSADIKGYVIERSKDGQSWSEIGTQSPNTNGTLVQHFIYNDQQPLKGQSYYRLRLNYTDGLARYSDTKTIVFIDDEPSATVLPNPVREKATLRIVSPDRSNADIQVLDANGRNVLRMKQAIQKGENNISLNNIGQMTSGVYTVRVTINSRSISTKLVVAK